MIDNVRSKMKKSIVFLLALNLLIISCKGKNQRSENASTVIQEKTVEVTGSNKTITVPNDTESITVTGDNNSVSTEDSLSNSN